MRMQRDMDLDFEKYCKVDESPRTVLPSPHHHERHARKSKSSSRNSRLSLEAGFKEIKFRNYQRSVSCKTLPTKNPELAIDKEVLKRGSVYQSSKERKSSNRPDSVGGRKKIEFSLSGDTPFSFSLLDSICGSDAEEEERPRESCSSRPAERDLLENSKFKSQQAVGPSTNGNILKEEDNQSLQKSLSAKLELPHSPTRLDLKSQSTPIRKMFDPLTKSKSHHGPLISKLESNNMIRSSDVSSNGRKKSLRKSLLHDFSTAAPQCSPAHLHGDLKLEQKHGLAYFEFSLDHSENLLMAETRKTEDALNWIYTFRSVSGRKKSNKESPMFGQMQVSCHLSSSNSMRTEFVLYDMSRKNFAAEEAGSDYFVSHASKEGVDDMFDPIKLKTQAAANDSEIGAVVIQVPFDKRDRNSTKISVVIPLGNHSLPSCESRGPSPLLDRWRLGGGCDCSGWDMACPLVVLDNLSTRRKGKEHSLLQAGQPFDLHVKGAKERNPALTINCTRKGQYSVDFHAQLSALQALAICVAILDTTEGSTMADLEKHRQLLHCSSLKVLVEDELRVLVEAITEEDKGKGKEKAVRATEDHPPSFVLNPPFSPIARV